MKPLLVAGGFLLRLRLRNVSTREKVMRAQLDEVVVVCCVVVSVDKVVHVLLFGLARSRGRFPSRRFTLRLLPTRYRSYPSRLLKVVFLHRFLLLLLRGTSFSCFGLPTTDRCDTNATFRSAGPRCSLTTP